LHFPEAYRAFEEFIPQDERSDLVTAYRKRLIGSDKKVQKEAALRWAIYETTCSLLYIDEKAIKRVSDNIEVRLEEKVEDQTLLLTMSLCLY
jgi:proline iminopeptidase